MMTGRLRNPMAGLAALAMLFLILNSATAQKASPEKKRDVASKGVVAATVDGQAIYTSAVLMSLKKVLGQRKVSGVGLAMLQAQVLEQLINQHLVRKHLKGTQAAASKQDIDRALKEFKAKLSTQNVSFEDLLKKGSVNIDQIRQQASWELTWKNYLGTHLTAKELEDFFKTHRKNFDGSQLAASHILFRPALSSDPQQLVKLARQAQQVRQAVIDRKLTFADAAMKYSQGPSRFQGGDLGFFPRRGVMEDAFAQAAFALEVGQISQPVKTRFGIHLILCTKIRPGNKKWTDVRDQLQGLAAKGLFQRLAQQQREGKEIRYTNAMPHFQPGTKKIVVPRH